MMSDGSSFNWFHWLAPDTENVRLSTVVKQNTFVGDWVSNFSVNSTNIHWPVRSKEQRGILKMYDFS